MTTCLLTFNTGQTAFFDGAANGLLHFTDADTPYGSSFTVAAATATPDAILATLRALHARFAQNAGPAIAELIINQQLEANRRYRETITRE